MNNNNNNNNNNKFFVLKDINENYWSVWTISPLNTVSKKNNVNNLKGAYTLWLYSNNKNKNFYKLGYWIQHWEKILSVILSYPLTKQWNLKYNQLLFNKIDKLDDEAINKLIILIQFFSSSNLFMIKDFISLILKKEIEINKMNSVLKVIKPFFWKNEKYINKHFDKLSKKEQKEMFQYWIKKDNLYLFIVFFHEFFHLTNLFRIKEINKIRKLFISLLNIDIIFLNKIELPSKQVKQIDLVYFETI